MQQEAKIVVVKYFVQWSNKLSRIAKQPVEIPNGVEINVSGQVVSFKGPKGEITLDVNPGVKINKEEKEIKVEIIDDVAIAGTMRALIYNNVIGVSQGYEKKLNLVGVGYKAEVKNKALHLSLGFSHPVNHELPDGVTAQTPSPTEILLKSSNKQMVGQVAAEIRAYRPPEPYKGKGVRYSDEYVAIKEAKKA